MNIFIGSLVSAADAAWKVSTDEISNLKQELVSIFNDTFSREVVDTQKVS